METSTVLIIGSVVRPLHRRGKALHTYTGAYAGVDHESVANCNATHIVNILNVSLRTCRYSAKHSLAIRRALARALASSCSKVRLALRTP